MDRLFTVIRDLRDQDVAILFVSHFLEQVYEISDRITVLRNGKTVGEYCAKDLPRGDLVTKMVGRAIVELEAISEIAERSIDRSATPVLRATGVGRRGVLEPADLDVYDGEVVGIAGLLGSGRTELVRLLYGADRADTGQVEPTAIPCGSRRRGTRSGTASRSRRRTGTRRASSPASPSARTSHSASRPGGVRHHKLRRAEFDAVVTEYIRALGVRPADPNVLVSTLSGGNQQKVLLARWLATAPELIILDEPTRGIDVGAKADIQRKVAELSTQGLSVIFISSELEEVLRLAQRVAVMRDRRQIGVLDSRDVDVDGLIDYMANEGEGSVA